MNVVYKSRNIRTFKDILDVVYDFDPEFYDVMRVYGDREAMYRQNFAFLSRDLKDMEVELEDAELERDEFKNALDHINTKIRRFKKEHQKPDADGKKAWDFDSISDNEIEDLVKDILESCRCVM